MSAAPNAVRLIGGTLKGSTVHFAPIKGLQPTPNRVRETLFNWLQPYIQGAHCLDMFAGSGALSFEALSRGAAHATLIERNTQQCMLLQEASQKFQLTTQVNNIQAEYFLAQQQHKSFDIVFIDPPFSENLWEQTVTALQKNGCARKALIYIEHPVNNHLDFSSYGVILKNKKNSKIYMTLLSFLH